MGEYKLMKQRSIIYCTVMSTLALAGCGGGGSSTPSNTTSNTSSIKAYTSNGILYKYEMYLNKTAKPVYTVNYTRGSLPQNAAIKNYNSLKEFIADKANLDSRFKNTPMVKNKHAGILANDISLASGMAVGYLPSVGQIFYESSVACYNTSAALVNTAQVSASTDFYMTDSTSSHVSTYSTSLGISSAFHALSASATDTYTRSYQENTSSGSFSLAAAVAGIVNTGIPQSNNVSPSAIAAYGTGPNPSFYQNCGSSAITAYEGGILTTLDLDVSATSNTVSQSFSNTLQAGTSSENVSKQFTLFSKTNSQDFSNINMSYTSYGDIQFMNPENNATDYTSYIANAIELYASDFQQCTATTPNLAACSTFNSEMSATIMQAVGYAQSAIANGIGASTLYAFPDGINMPVGDSFSNPQVSASGYIAYVPANSNSFTQNTNDISAANSLQLQNAVQLVYALNTLGQRANLLATMTNEVTPSEAAALTQLANYYFADSKTITSAANNCYQAILDSGQSNPTQCTNMPLSLASGGVTSSLAGLPNNPYELYYSGNYNVSVVPLLYKNSIALQYNVLYNEMTTGIAANGDLIRAGNQIPFGIAFYNAATATPEFYGNNQAGASNSGYILASQNIPQLKAPGQGNNYYNPTSNNGYSLGTEWVQLYDNSASVILQALSYPESSLYFTLFDANNRIDFFNPGQYQASLGAFYNVGLNKIIAPNSLTVDSQSVNNSNQNAIGLSLFNQVAYTIPNIFGLASGQLLPSFGYQGEGYVIGTYNNSDTGAASCLSGTFLPSLSGSTITKSYGYPNLPYGYFCANNGSSAYFALNSSSTGGTSYSISSPYEVIMLSFTPINNFFGFQF